MRGLLKNNRGQTSLEYLMLLAVAFITSYLMITGPVSTFAIGMINNIKSVTGSIVQHGEMNTKNVQPGSPDHPMDRSRLKPLHL